MHPRIFVPFFIASLVLTLTRGATLGMINLTRLTTDWGLGALARSSVYAHTYGQVFGFMALFDGSCLPRVAAFRGRIPAEIDR